MLGGVESRKEALLKQMEIEYKYGSNLQELVRYRRSVWKFVVNTAKLLVSEMKALGIEPHAVKCLEHSALINDFEFDLASQAPLTTCFQNAVEELWKDSCISPLVKMSQEFYMIDCAAQWVNQLTILVNKAKLLLVSFRMSRERFPRTISPVRWMS